MKRYNRAVFYPYNSKDILKAFTDSLNSKDFKYTKHSIDNLKHRVIDISRLLNYIKNIKLSYDDIFEYYIDDIDNILKACYRVNYTKDIDIILVLSDNKSIITIYINSKEDNHITLNKRLYAQV